MKIRFEWSTREAYLLDKLEKNTIGKLKQVTTKLKNIMNKSKVTTLSAEQYDTLWGRLEDELDDLYNNNPNAWDLENYDLELEGNEIRVEQMTMGYDHNDTAHKLLKLLEEKGIIKIKENK